MENEREQEPQRYVCQGCGKEFDSLTTSHGRADHAPGCDGSCENCPVEVGCGPIVAWPPPLEPLDLREMEGSLDDAAPPSEDVQRLIEAYREARGYLVAQREWLLAIPAEMRADTPLTVAVRALASLDAQVRDE